jgi:acetylornithine deacetylase ArgE
MTVIDLAKQIISFDTSGPPTKELPLAKWINDFFIDLRIESMVQEVAQDRGNVVAKMGEGKRPGLVLSGHIDVVPAGDLSLWKTGPYDPDVRDGKLYGRGACDMKGPDACILQAAKELKNEKFKRQLVLVFTAGEDTGGWFVDKVLSDELVTTQNAAFGVIAEPSMMNIVRTHKGGGGAVVMIHGRAAHSSRPELGINAILKASDFLQEIKALQVKLNKKKHPLLGSTTIKPTLIKGGFKANIIPDLCEITLNMRCLPEHSKKEVINKWIVDIFEKLSRSDQNFKADIKDLRASEALDVAKSLKIVKLLKEILGTDAIGVPYYTEAVSYTKAGIPTVICGPGDIDQAHAPNEFISINQLEKGVEVYKQLINKVCI